MAHRASPARLTLPAGVAAGLGAAALLAALLWHRLPYDALGRTTAAERFWAWEGIVWMTGLALTLRSVGVLVEVRCGIQPRRRLAGIPAAHWVMMSFGVGLIVVPAIARLLVGG
jgi:hypothetical protein